MRVLLFASIAVLAASGCQESQASSPSARPTPTSPTPSVKAPRGVLGQEARAQVAAGAALVDVRTVDEFEELHIDGAKNIPLDQLAEQMASIPKGKPVVVYCASGARSSVAASLLGGAGYEVLDLGGMGNWNR